MPRNTIQNFQIPVLDFDRALAFYSKVMGYKLEEMQLEDVKLGVFRCDDDDGVSGTIILGGDQKPSREGSLIYLQCNNDLNEHLEKVEEAGGEIHIKKTELGPGVGFYAIIHDTEGNRVGLYAGT